MVLDKNHIFVWGQSGGCAAQRQGWIVRNMGGSWPVVGAPDTEAGAYVEGDTEERLVLGINSKVSGAKHNRGSHRAALALASISTHQPV